MLAIAGWAYFCSRLWTFGAEGGGETDTPKQTRTTQVDTEICIMCQKSTSKTLQNVRTDSFGETHKAMANEMNDIGISLKLDIGNLVSLGVKYHKSCDTKFYHK